MRDKNLVNKPVKVEQIIEAVRCFANPSMWMERVCDDCRFWETKTLTPEDQKRYGVPVWKYCNTTKVCTMAADRLANDQTHIAALQKEIEQLRSDRRWIPVTERLPEIESFGTSKVLLGIVENETEFPPPNPCFCVYLGNGKWAIRGFFATITHWMPLPEAPEVE